MNIHENERGDLLVQPAEIENPIDRPSGPSSARSLVGRGSPPVPAPSLAFGWIKTIGTLRKTRHRGMARVGWMFTLTAAACNLLRLPKLLEEG
jgi:hypothetical protein